MSIPLAVVWHQHQPYYKDLASGHLLLPWVRLHGVKDYYGMARLLRDFPGVHCTINLVPSLLAQLVDYVEKGASDPFLQRTEISADSLSHEDVCFILDHFFMANWDRMVRVHPRYRELLELRRPGRGPASRAAHEFSTQDLRDLQVWFNLAWFHPVSFEESEALRELRTKDRGFTEHDKAVVLREQRQVLARVIPLHRELAARGQIELTTSPFYHPILPLLCDMTCVQAALPRAPLPSGHVPLVEDAQTQIRRGVEYHTQLFGAAPEGMWPSEGSVSAGIVPLIARQGIKWIATDEEILSASLAMRLRKGAEVEHPELLYRAWRVEAGGEQLSVVFRDHDLSDLIGFHYQRFDAVAAAEDFVARVKASVGGRAAGAETLVPVILDGENCWEHYAEQGVAFLRELYARLEKKQGHIEAVRVSDHLKAHPPTRRLEKLFPGSWVNHDFYIWAGHAEDRRAWEYVYRVREDLVNAARGALTVAQEDQALPHAWEELYIAEGSDWFWWYGDDHTSGNDEAFDNLFRTHLKNVYKFIGQPAPFFLNVPVKGGSRARRYSTPTASLRVTIDGRCSSYFEWLGAGRYRTASEGGVMSASHRPVVEQIYFGYDRECLCIRVDIPGGQGQQAASGLARGVVTAVSVRFMEVGEALYGADGPAVRIDAADPAHAAFEGPWCKLAQPTVEVAWGDVLELRVPFAGLGVKEGTELAFYIMVTTADGLTERFPRACALELTVPTAQHEEEEWMA
jgi:alpha-amylase/alpha-mannosidase (GH57 family)